MVYSCDRKPTWTDRGSGGTRDLSLHRVSAAKGYSVDGGYAQGNYEPPYGCVALVPATDPTLLATPVQRKWIWADKGSGARMDGSIWEAVAPSPAYVCIGALGVKGYNVPKVANYSCVHRCLVREFPTSHLIWTDEHTGAKAKVSLYVLPSSNTFVAFPSRNGPQHVRDIDPVAVSVAVIAIAIIR